MRNYQIGCEFKEETMQGFEECFKSHHLKFKRGREIKERQYHYGRMVCPGVQKNHLSLSMKFSMIPK